MNLFSISQLSRLSGIKSHTIRIWEQRYDALTPNRSEGNTRYYDNKQLRRLLNIVSLMKMDYKVSELSAMPDKKLFKLIEELSVKDLKIDTTEYFILQLISAGMNYDEVDFDKILSHCLLKYGMKNAYIDIIYPMLNRVGIMWTTDLIQPAAEHFISNLVRQKLFTAIDSLPAAKETLESWILFLPENEFHEIGLLFSHFLIRHSGSKSIYLGTNVPLESIKETVNLSAPDNLLLFLTHNEAKEETQHYINKLSMHFKNKKVNIAGDPSFAKDVAKNKNIRWLHSVENLEQLLPV
ncbi:MAG: MerR family transcriptional regulator [Ginsengibacter sp.]